MVNSTTNMSDLTALFVGAGLSEQKAKETLKNDGVTQSFKSAIEQVGTKEIFIG